MGDKQKLKKKKTLVINSDENECPIKEGDNCKVPGVFNDSEPIGGA